MELYEFDLSLFGGELLAGVLPASTEPADNVDGHKSMGEVLTDWALPPPSQQELTSIEDVCEQQTEAWMESSMDLLEIMAQSDEADPVMSLAVSYDCSNKGSSLSALKALQEVAKETSEMLENPSTLPAAQSVKTDQPQNPADESVTSLFKFLESGMESTDTFIELPQVDENILSPFTADEVDSILSSEPSSPCASTSFTEEISPQTSSSLLAHYLTTDIKEILPQSPGTLDSSTETSDDPDYMPSYRVSKTQRKPYTREKKSKESKTPEDKQLAQMEKKMRKKQQNKDAATRYRQKKKQEALGVDEECDQLEQRNQELKDTVAEMTREIGYLKNLLADVYTAKKKLIK